MQLKCENTHTPTGLSLSSFSVFLALRSTKDQSPNQCGHGERVMEVAGMLCMGGFAMFILPLHQKHNYPLLVLLCAQAVCAVNISAMYMEKPSGMYTEKPTKAVISTPHTSATKDADTIKQKSRGDKDAAVRNKKKVGNEPGGLPCTTAEDEDASVESTSVVTQETATFGKRGPTAGSLSLDERGSSGGGLPFALLVMLDWMGRSGYFFLGNSNSLATIDISRAYTVS
jgi:hypothetical protein